jgi:hypothetical protein
MFTGMINNTFRMTINMGTYSWRGNGTQLLRVTSLMPAFSPRSKDVFLFVIHQWALDVSSVCMRFSYLLADKPAGRRTSWSQASLR